MCSGFAFFAFAALISRMSSNFRGNRKSTAKDKANEMKKKKMKQTNMKIMCEHFNASVVGENTSKRKAKKQKNPLAFGGNLYFVDYSQFAFARRIRFQATRVAIDKRKFIAIVFVYVCACLCAVLEVAFSFQLVLFSVLFRSFSFHFSFKRILFYRKIWIGAICIKHTYSTLTVCVLFEAQTEEYLIVK